MAIDEDVLLGDECEVIFPSLFTTVFREPLPRPPSSSNTIVSESAAGAAFLALSLTPDTNFTPLLFQE